MKRVSRTLTAALFISTSLSSQPIQRASSGGIGGAILDSDEKPLANVVVAEISTRTSAATNSAGEFNLGHLKPGLNSILAKRIGFKPVMFTVNIPSDSIVWVVIRMSSIATELPDVLVSAKISERLYSVGFADRQSRIKGFFLNRADIDRQSFSRTSDILRVVPGVHLQVFGARGSIPYGRTGCVMSVFIDSVPVKLQAAYPFRLTLDDIISPSMIEGIEVYSGATEAPSEFAEIARACGVVVIWTRK